MNHEKKKKKERKKKKKTYVPTWRLLEIPSQRAARVRSCMHVAMKMERKYPELNRIVFYI